jgi:hypothetical protein
MAIVLLATGGVSSSVSLQAAYSPTYALKVQGDGTSGPKRSCIS